MMNKMMKKLAVLFTIGALAVAGCTVSVNAFDGLANRTQAEIQQELSSYSKLWTCMADTANIRKSPSENSAIISNLSYGDVIEVKSYTSNGWIGLSCGGYIRGDLLENGVVYVDGEVASDVSDDATNTATTAYTGTTSDTTYSYQPAEQVDTVVYPRVDKHLSGPYTTWCSLNTDGYYYNEKGERFADNGNGSFSDVYGNILTVIG